MIWPVARTERDEIAGEAYRLLARAQADADAIRREALVTAEGIRQIALEDARTVDLTGDAPPRPRSEPAAAHNTAAPHAAELLARVERVERKLKRQRRQIERLEAVLLGIAPGLSNRSGRRKKR
jgi:hypothetical protein